VATQTLIFVALPNGVSAAGNQQLSIYLTPRLDQGATLAAFPDILQWTTLLKSQGLTFTIQSNGNAVSVAADIAGLRPDLWQILFNASTFVEPFQIPDFDQRLIVSYPVRDAQAYLKSTYQQIGTGLGSADDDRPVLLRTLGPLVFRDENNNSTLSAAISQMRLEMWNEQRNALATGTTSSGGPATTSGPPPSGLPPPDGVPSTPNGPSDTTDTITRFALFHNMPPAPGAAPLPKTEADFARTLDFHRALSALTSYPTLLRALGLVFDIELPKNWCASSPAGTGYLTVAVGSVTPGFAWKLAPTFNFPLTAYVADAKSFRIAPATPPGAGPGAWLRGDVVNGFLNLAPEDFNLLEVDLDGALLKALGLADNLANAAFRSSQTQAVQVVGDSVPALRSAGIGLIATGRGMQLLQGIADNTSFDQALQSGTTMPRPFDVRDLMRGFRLDVWSSRTRQWHSLHRRRATYSFGPSGQVKVANQDEEGFLQPTAAQPTADPTRPPDPVATANNIPQPGTDLYFNERVARWQGWSLSAFRPGLALNRDPDPSLATTADPTINQPMTPFKMTTAFAALPGSLPELRFAAEYRVRARAVDLAGNSLAPGAALAPTLDPALPADGLTFPYQRFEPVPPPLLVLLKPTEYGSGQLRMVIRSRNSQDKLDAVPTSDSDSRHVLPPQTSARLAEQHGMLDAPNGHLRSDAALFNDIAVRDKFKYPEQGGVPIVSGPLATVGYLPDPIARGAAFRNLPNTADNTDGRVTDNSLAYTPLPGVQPRAGSVTFIDFGSQWPQRTAFRFTIVEGSAAPTWDAATHLLTARLPKASFATVELSSYLSPADLETMGVWTWLSEYFALAEAMSAGHAISTVTDAIALLTQLALEGGHDMITPAAKLTLIHAVQQPLGKPQFVQLPVVHLPQPSQIIYASALRNEFTPITAWRAIGSHSATLLGALQINGASTAKIELQAQWLEYIDETSLGAPTRTAHGGNVDTIPLGTLNAGEIYSIDNSDPTNKRGVAVYIPSVDTLWFSSPIDVLAGVSTPSDVAAPLHRFGDTKHRWINYQATATSRFEEYFPAGLDFTRSSDALLVDVPSSARPLAPDIAYVVPTFGWQRAESGNVKSEVRFGNGLRVYLNRPWFSSGGDELLGAVLWPAQNPAGPPDYPTRDKYKSLFTQWGNDPIWTAGFLAEVPAIGNFPSKVNSATGLALEETTDITVDVAGHSVTFDSARDLWYCDVTFANAYSYMPFVRLALARYQPHSITGVELSRAVLADYAQLTPDRSAVITIDPADPRRATVFVGGIAPTATPPSQIDVSVERRVPGVVSDIGWELPPAGIVQVIETTPPPAEPQAILWSGEIVFAAKPAQDQFRVVIREYERIQIDGAAGTVTYGERLVYVSIIDYDFPA
jgi:hypothetical protein